MDRNGLIRSKDDTLDSGKDVNVPILKVITTACVVTWFNPQALIDGSMMLGAFKATLPAGTDFLFCRRFRFRFILMVLIRLYRHIIVQRKIYG